MARPIKQGLDYFPMDINFFSDIKIRKLIRYQSGKAVTVYAYLLCNIYENGYYMLWDDELPFIISETTGFEEAYIQEVIKCCMNIGLIDKDMFEKNRIITSKGIQQRFKEISTISKRKNVIKKYSLINSEETLINSEETLINSEETLINSEETLINSEFSTQRKEKKRKVKERKVKCVEIHTKKIMTFQEKLSLFKTEYLNSERFEKTCMTLNVRPDVLKKYFKEFTDAQECGSKHEGIVNYAEFSNQMSNHFFNTVRYKLKNENQTKPRNGFNDALDELLILNSDS
ncbi:MAG: DUF4373 domain-containing protein [Bacteroidales bacterium]